MSALPWEDDASDISSFSLRAPCQHCGHLLGYITTKNGQDTVRCLNCDRFLYNAPRTETGREQRTVATRPKIKPSRKVRIIERDGGRCVICGSTVDLHVDHMISRAVAEKFDLLDDLIDSDLNLATLCAECNLGKGDDCIDPRIMYRLLVIRSKQPPA